MSKRKSFKKLLGDAAYNFFDDMFKPIGLSKTKQKQNPGVDAWSFNWKSKNLNVKLPKEK